MSETISNQFDGQPGEADDPLTRPLPAVPFVLSCSDDEARTIDEFASSANALIAELRDRVVDLQFQVQASDRRAQAGVEVFNEMIAVANTTADTIIAEARVEAVAIIDAATDAARRVDRAADTAPPAEPPADDVSFEEAWNQPSTSVEERFAEEMFFEREVGEAPARRWILKNTG